MFGGWSRSVLLVLLVAVGQTLIACSAPDDPMASGSRLSRGGGDDDDDDDGASSKKKNKKQKTDDSSETTPAPSTSAETTPVPATTPPVADPPSTPASPDSPDSPEKSNFQKASEELNACLTGAADDQASDQCFTDFAVNLGGGDASASNGAPCCTGNGVLFTCPQGSACGGAECTSLALFSDFCG